MYFNEGRLSKTAILQEIDGSLKRLGTDYLDLYIIHRFDYDTPIEETMEALHDLIKAGKVRALGALAVYGYQFYNMQTAATQHGWMPFSAMENRFNLIYREDERELIPICKQMQVSPLPYSPLAAGYLARPKWRSDSVRGKTDRVAVGKYDHMEQNFDDRGIIWPDAIAPFQVAILPMNMHKSYRVQELAEKHRCTMSQIAIAWQWAKGAASPIIGATKVRYLDDAVDALDVALTLEDVDYLEKLYVSNPIVGAIDKNPEQGVMLLDEKK